MASTTDDKPLLITKVDLVEEVIDVSAKPAIRFRVTAQTETGQLVLWISTDAFRELAAHWEHLSQGKRSPST